MPNKSYKPNEIAAKLQQVDALVSQGQTVADAISETGVSEPFTRAPLQPPHASNIPKQTVRIYSNNYLVRTIKLDDASNRWAEWMSEPEAMHMLNSPARTWKKSDVINYIKQFDQRSRLLVGVFEKSTWKHIGILTIEIDFTASRFLVNYLVGEPEYRNKGVTNDITVPFRDYLFETLGLETMACTALSRNHVIIHYLLKTGWKLEKTLKEHVKSNSDGSMLDLCFFSLSRDAWRAWKKEHPEGVQ
jgi:RimJ/RimL family protein N-acetyltransferase